MVSSGWCSSINGQNPATLDKRRVDDARRSELTHDRRRSSPHHDAGVLVLVGLGHKSWRNDLLTHGPVITFPELPVLLIDDHCIILVTPSFKFVSRERLRDEAIALAIAGSWKNVDVPDVTRFGVRKGENDVSPRVQETEHVPHCHIWLCNVLKYADACDKVKLFADLGLGDVILNYVPVPIGAGIHVDGGH
jgi:hypothetical protein